MSIKSTYRPPISLQHSTNRYVIETNNPAPPALCLDDRSTYPISQHARTTKYASKTQSHEQGKNRPTKPSASMESSSKTSFLKAKSSRELDINGHICPDLEVDKISLEAGHSRKRSKVSVALPIVSSATRICSSLSKAQPPENLLNTPIEGLNKSQDDSSVDSPLDNDRLNQGTASLNRINQLLPQSEASQLCRSLEKNNSSFYPVLIDKASNTMVNHMQTAWQASLEQKYSQIDTDAKDALLSSSNPNASIGRRDRYVLSVEQFFTREGKGINGRCRVHGDTIKSPTGAGSCAHPRAAVADRALGGTLSRSAPGDYCGHHKLCNSIYSSAREHNEQHHQSLIETPLSHLVPQRPYTGLNRIPHVLSDHMKFLQEPRKRAIRALIKSLPATVKASSIPLKLISATTQQLGSTDQPMHVLINGEQVPITYSTDDSPVVSKLRNNFSYTDLEFTLGAHTNLNTRLRTETKVDTSTHQYLQKRATEIDIAQQSEKLEQLEQLKQSPPKHQLDSKDTRAQKRSILINNVCSVPLRASPTKNPFCSPLNFSNVDSDEDCTHACNSLNDLLDNSVTKQRTTSNILTLKRREDVLKNDTLRSIANSLKSLEAMQQTRKSSRSFAKAQQNSVTEILPGYKESTTRVPSPHSPRSPRKRAGEHNSLEGTLHLKDLATQSMSLEPTQGYNNCAPINSVSSAFPQTAKSTRFFTFNA